MKQNAGEVFAPVESGEPHGQEPAPDETGRVAGATCTQASEACTQWGNAGSGNEWQQMATSKLPQQAEPAFPNETGQNQG